MVLHKRLDYGFSGYQIPTMPHVPKSARRKRSTRKKAEENKMCAFDLLATVAGQLLTEGEGFSSPCNITGTSFPTAGNDIVKDDPSVQVNSIKTELLDQYSCSDGILHSEIVPKRSFSYDIKEQSHAAMLASELAPEKFGISNKDTIVEESIVDHGSESKCLLSATPEKYNSERHPSSSMESHKYTEVVKTPTPAERRMVGNVMDMNTPDLYNLEDPMDMDIKPPALVSSDSSAEVPAYRNNLPRNSSFPKYGHGLELAIDKDDDENSSGCTHPCILNNKPSRLQRIGDRRIRKHLSSKYWNVSPTVVHEKGFSSYDVEKKPVFRGKKMSYMRQRTHRGPFKRKKVLECGPVPKGEVYHEMVSSLCQKSGIKLEQSNSNATLHGVNDSSSSLTGPKSSIQSSEYSVKLSISSFKIPELFIEMSETATVASLKKTVVEAVTAILGGGLRVGVLLQGRKVRDDNKTLRQAGILHSDKLDNLGFMLEPDRTQVSPSLMASEDLHLSSLTTPNELSDRIVPISTAPIVEVGADFTPQPLVTIRPESDHDSIYSPADASCLDKPISTSQALVVIPPINSDSMSVVPLRKSKRSEVAQRRIRRPFSVTEVEALVQAVEMLGTGRWRDVKLRAFDNAKHRTYVDLKDKWKTLVHTARISPQQRRGEPVPQELLDRVLAAHAYWSQQQAKLQIKPPTSETLLLI